MNEIYCRVLERPAFALETISVFKQDGVVMIRVRCECGGLHDVPANKELEING